MYIHKVFIIITLFCGWLVFGWLRGLLPCFLLHTPAVVVVSAVAAAQTDRYVAFVSQASLGVAKQTLISEDGRYLPTNLFCLRCIVTPHVCVVTSPFLYNKPHISAKSKKGRHHFHCSKCVASF